MPIQQVVDSIGTVLNQYTLKHVADDTEEEVLLTFSPSQDYQAGTPFNAATMNPIIDLINEFTSRLYGLSFAAMTVSEYNALTEKDNNTIYFTYGS